jgi:7,8-dihydropterin-6-yl-methyl-4-(beta-D-ribofuranosyl)aminobenzene 5'-phosphate synthase
VVGGFHLAGPNEKIIPQTVEAVRGFSLSTIAAGHCTGWRAVKAFADAVGENVVDPSVVGKRYTF